MSDLQDDKKQAESRTPMKDVKVSLRDQHISKLYDTLQDEEVGTKLAKAWSMATNNIATVLDKQKIYDQDLDDFNLGESEGKFGGVSNIHLPTSFIVCKTYHARFLEALLGIDPPFSVKARREDGVNRVPVVEDLMRYALMQWSNTNQGIEEAVDAWVWNWCTKGTAIMRARWLTTYESYLDVVEEKFPLPPLFHVDDKGQEFQEAQWGSREVDKLVTVKTFDGPQYDYIPLEDFRMIGGKGNPDLADKIMYRSFFTASELWTKVDQGVFLEEAVAKVIEGGKDSETGSDQSGLKLQTKQNTGITNSGHDETELDRYEIIECIFRYDVLGNGINSDVVAWVDRQSGEILGCTYLRRIMPTGQRPYSVIHFHKRPGEEYGIGLLEILHPLSKELDAMHNIRIDNAIFQSIPFGFYRATSSLDPETIQLEPGALIPLDNPQTDVYFPSLPNRTPFTAQEEQVIQSYVERLTGISDLSLGVMSGTQGPTRTAEGVRAVLGENNNNLSVHLRRLNKGWTKILRTTWHLVQDRTPPGFCFRITGQDGQDVYRKVSNTDLALEVDFDLQANTSNSNKAVQIEVNQQLVNMTMNPMNVQLGLCGPSEIYAAQKQYANSLGVKDIHRFLKKPEGYFYNLDAGEEFQRIIRGEKIQIHPAADHQAFLAFAQTFLATEADPKRLNKSLNAEQTQAVISQMKDHQKIMEAMQQAEANQAVKQQMMQNSAASGASAPASLNTLSGQDPGKMF